MAKVKTADKTIRVNIRLSQKIKSYFEEKSFETGVAQSALMALALEEYIDQKEAIKMSSNIDSMVQKLQELKRGE